VTLETVPRDPEERQALIDDLLQEIEET